MPIPLNKFDNSMLRIIQKDLKEALQAVADKHGIGLDIQSKKLTTMSLAFETTFAVKKADGTVMTQGRADFERHASQFGLSPSDFGRSFLFKGKPYRITGLNPGAWRFPIEADRVRDGKGFRFPADQVARSLMPVAKAA